MRPSSIVPVGTNHHCGPLELLGPQATCVICAGDRQKRGFPLTPPHSLWGSREVEVGARGRGWSSAAPSSSLLRAGLHAGSSTPLPMNIQGWERPAQTPQTWAAHGLLRSQVSLNGGVPFPSAFCMYQRKEQVIPTLSPGLFSTALWALSPSGNQRSHVPFLFHYAKQTFNQKVCCFILGSSQGKKNNNSHTQLQEAGCHSRER